VPVIVVATAARSPSATSSSIATSTSGKASRSVAKKRLTPSTPGGKPGGMLWLVNPGAKKSSAAFGSRESNSAACRRRTSAAASLTM
jgi:hypothetical protein